MSKVEQAVVGELVGNARGDSVRVRELLDAHRGALNYRIFPKLGGTSRGQLKSVLMTIPSG